MNRSDPAIFGFKWENDLHPAGISAKNTSLTTQPLIFDAVQKLKGIVAVFSLLVFLFPMVEKEIHNYDHAGIIHCTEHNVVHFHNVEHHCFLCDFTNPVSTSTLLNKIAFAEHQWVEGQFFLYEFSYSLQSKYFHSLRGPPAIA